MKIYFRGGIVGEKTDFLNSPYDSSKELFTVFKKAERSIAYSGWNIFRHNGFLERANNVYGELFVNLIDAIAEHHKSDGQLLKRLNRTSEYAEIYLLAKQRQKGGDEIGEVATRLTSGFFKKSYL